jgi:hypothetical protein
MNYRSGLKRLWAVATVLALAVTFSIGTFPAWSYILQFGKSHYKISFGKLPPVSVSIDAAIGELSSEEMPDLVGRIFYLKGYFETYRTQCAEFADRLRLIAVAIPNELPITTAQAYIFEPLFPEYRGLDLTTIQSKFEDEFGPCVQLNNSSKPILAKLEQAAQSAKIDPERGSLIPLFGGLAGITVAWLALYASFWIADGFVKKR